MTQRPVESLRSGTCVDMHRELIEQRHEFIDEHMDSDPMVMIQGGRLLRIGVHRCGKPMASRITVGDIDMGEQMAFEAGCGAEYITEQLLAGHQLECPDVPESVKNEIRKERGEDNDNAV
jgi:hypothetical protein